MISYILSLFWGLVAKIIIFASSVWCFLTRKSCDTNLDTSFKPVDLAYKIIVPKFENKSLNPIIYVHDLAASKELWQDVPQLLSKRTKRKSYIYDARNHGDSEWTDDYSMDLMVKDLSNFMHSKNIAKAIIIGHSLGGLTACLFALRNPDKVEMLIIEDVVFNAELRVIATHAIAYLKLWEEAVKSIPIEMDAPQGIKHAFNYIYDKSPFKQILQEKEIPWKYNYPIKRTSSGYDVKHNVEVICNTLDDWVKIDIQEHQSPYIGPTYFMMSCPSHYHRTLRDHGIMKHFPNAETELIEGVSRNMHMQYPIKFTDKVLIFYNKHFNPSNEQIMKKVN